MSGDVKANPKALREFAQFLSRFSSEMENEASRVQGRLGSLGETWKDGKFREFEREIRDVVKALHRFSQASEEYKRYLNGKADDLERYLRR